MRLYTIGFTRTSARHFFERLAGAGVRTVVDVRLANASQLAGFAKKDDLAYFAERLVGAGYEHRVELAPTRTLLDGYREGSGGWTAYAEAFVELLRARRVEDTVPRSLLDGACLLCSEHAPEHCHRRLVAEYLAARWGGVEIVHL